MRVCGCTVIPVHRLHEKRGMNCQNGTQFKMAEKHRGMFLEKVFISRNVTLGAAGRLVLGLRGLAEREEWWSQ